MDWAFKFCSDLEAFKSHIGLLPLSNSQLHGENAALSNTVRFLLRLSFFSRKLAVIGKKTNQRAG